MLENYQRFQRHNNQTQQLDSSMEQVKDYKNFNFFFTGIKKNLIEAKQVLNDSSLSYEARVENTKRIIQNQLLGGSLLNQNDDELDEKQTIQEQNNVDNDDSSIIHTTIQNMFNKNKQLFTRNQQLLTKNLQFTRENKLLKEENLSLTDQNRTYKYQINNDKELFAVQRERLNLQIANFQQSLEEQIQKYARLTKKHEQVQSTKLSEQKLLLEMKQIKQINDSLNRQNSKLKKEISDLSTQNTRLQRQNQQILVKHSNELAQKRINHHNQNEVNNNLINSLEQSLQKLQNKKNSQDNNYFVNQLREKTQIQAQQIRHEIVDKNGRIPELEQRIKNLESELQEKIEKIRKLQNQTQQEVKMLEQKTNLIQQIGSRFKEQQGQLLNKIKNLDQLIAQKDQMIRKLIAEYQILKEEYSQISKEFKNLQAELMVAKSKQIHPKTEIITELKRQNERLILEIKNFKRPTKSSVYKYIQDIFRLIPQSDKKELKTNLISILSTIV